MFQPNLPFGVSVLQGLAPKRRALMGRDKTAGEKALTFGFFNIFVIRPLIFFGVE